MTWNYRIVKHLQKDGDEDWYALHEVYYDNEEQPWGMTTEPCRISGNSEDDVKDALVRALKDVTKNPVLQEPEEGKWPGKSP